MAHIFLPYQFMTPEEKIPSDIKTQLLNEYLRIKTLSETIPDTEKVGTHYAMMAVIDQIIEELKKEECSPRRLDSLAAGLRILSDGNGK